MDPDTLTWYIEAPHQLKSVDKELNRFYVGGSMYMSGALYSASREEVADVVRDELGPAEEDPKPRSKIKPVWVLALVGVTTAALALFWLFLKTMILLAAVPMLFFSIKRAVK